MRLALTLALVLAAAPATRQGCGSGGSHAYEPCGGKACGVTCRACDPSDPGCVETAVVKACDPFGRCVPLVGGICEPSSAACAGKTCGDPCTIDPPCRSATPPCMVPSLAGNCDPSGTCVPGGLTPNFCPPPVPSCAGAVCGVRCELPCSGTGCTAALGWCDGGGQCLAVAPPCALPDPCAGKKCGDVCDRCGGACMNPVATACDASGACMPLPVTCGP